jgi:Mg-chelatase subunit ChlD
MLQFFDMDWATKRKLQYLGIIIASVLLFLVTPFFIFVYEAPTCFDGVKNGEESGVDCGGSCVLLCSAEVPEPISRWDPRIFRIAPGVYSVLAYLENANAGAEVIEAPYSFKLYDREGILIAERKGETFIPRGQFFAVFEPNISTGERIPTRATFNFPEPLIWTRNVRPAPAVEVVNKALLNEETSPRVEVSVSNDTLDRIQNIDLTAIVFDGSGNAIGASRTYLEALERGEETDVVFTWPAPFETKAEVCQSPVDVVLALDRSGSMAAFGSSPPQPLTDVKNAAVSFINQLDEKDQASVVSFATEASLSDESTLSSQISRIRASIDAISILEGSIQQTNVTEAIIQSTLELSSPRKRAGVPGVIILLTDGVATLPENARIPNYPELSALAAGEIAKERGFRLFTIGLGKDLNTAFLSTLASAPEDSYLSPTTNDLSGIYSQIATKICKKQPASIEIIPRIFPKSIIF